SVLDKVKRRYKKKKSRMDEMGLDLNSCKWQSFNRMDKLMSSSVRREYGLSCGVDSGEYVFMNMRVYLNMLNGFDEVRDSPGESMFLRMITEKVISMEMMMMRRKMMVIRGEKVSFLLHGIESSPARKQVDINALFKFKKMAEKAKNDDKEIKKLQ
ncbi:hypothetical protein RYX36_026885, partial [Vicia faba]